MAGGPWGYHLIADLGGCDRAVVTDPDALRAWVVGIVDVVQMQPHGEPHVIHFGVGELAGWTVQQLITTSNVNAHFMDHNGDGYVDLFSCTPFVLGTVVDYLYRTLQPQSLDARLLTRRAGRPARDLAVESVQRAGEPVTA